MNESEEIVGRIDAKKRFYVSHFRPMMPRESQHQ